jgi:K+-transporting ATPase KdpF subunit
LRRDARRRPGTEVTDGAAAHLEATEMIDVLYVVATVLFFSLVLAYAAACDRLGRGADVDRPQRGLPMTYESWIAGVLAVAMLLYLGYTLLRPENF